MLKIEPFFSIVIPTRNRADTLKYTIKTILNQSFQDYEIIVCNNNSIDYTEEVINTFCDKRIKYITSNIDLSMTDNWELAYTKVQGKYVTYIADNDGFIDGALLFMYKLLTLNHYPNIIRWEKNLYNWPCLDSVNKNTLFINLNKEFELYDSHTVIEEVIDGKKKFQDLPMLYNSFIKNELINAFKIKTKKVFHSVCPDISSGFSFAIIEKKYISLSYGITCGANSAKSNGYNGLRKENKTLKEFKELIKKSKIGFSDNIPHVKSLMAAVVESYLKVAEVLEYKEIELDFKKIYLSIMENITIVDKMDLEETKNKIIEASKFDSELYDFIIDSLEKNPLKMNSRKDSKNTKGFYQHKNMLILDGEDFCLYNIEQVCKFMGNFYSYSLNEISFPIFSSFNLDLIENFSRIAIWGNGSYSQKFQELILEKRNDLNIYCIIDSFKEDSKNKIPILVPKNVDFTNVDYLIIASSFLSEIQKTLLTLDLKDIKILKYESK